MLGDSGVGKTSIVDKYFSGTFDQTVASTVGAAYVKATVQVQNLQGKTQDVQLNIWDTAGQERFQSLIPLYMRNARGLIFVFDVTNENSLEILDNLFKEIQEQLESDMIFILCANKIDLVDELQLDLTDIEAWAHSHGMELQKTSAKTGQGISDLYSMAASLIIAKGETRKDRAETILKDIVQDDSPAQRQQSAGCGC